MLHINLAFSYRLYESYVTGTKNAPHEGRFFGLDKQDLSRAIKVWARKIHPILIRSIVDEMAS